jgi:hypothetical protein
VDFLGRFVSGDLLFTEGNQSAFIDGCAGLQSHESRHSLPVLRIGKAYDPALKAASAENADQMRDFAAVGLRDQRVVFL